MERNMKFAYFPGCTLETKAIGFDRSARQVAGELDVDLVTLPEWNCCGATFPLSTDNLLDIVGPARNLVSAAEAGESTLVVACATCFNVLRRTNHALQQNDETLEKINFFLERPVDYAGQVQVRHLLDIFDHEVGQEKIAQRAQPGLGGLRVAAYYGCMLLRPADEIALDDPEQPDIMDRLFRSMGAETVDFPHRGECCGAYLTVRSPEASMEITHRILTAAVNAGADVIATACPLCQFNLDWLQNRMTQAYAGFQKIPILYFTQLMGLAMGLDATGYEFEKHYVDPQPLLRNAGLLHTPSAEVVGRP